MSPCFHFESVWVLASLTMRWHLLMLQTANPRRCNRLPQSTVMFDGLSMLDFEFEPQKGIETSCAWWTIGIETIMKCVKYSSEQEKRWKEWNGLT